MKEGTAKRAFYYLFTLLAGHTPLQDLNWARLMYQDFIEGAMKATEQPFSQMRRLKCHATRMAMATLLPCLSRFEVLDLNLDLNAPITNAIGLLSSLAGCSNLRDLEIYYRNSWILSDGVTVLNE